MASIPTPLKGITSLMVPTSRLETHVLTSGPASGIPVIFLHGNFASALYWEEIMQSLPAGYRGIAPDLRGYGWTEDKLIDSTRGMCDFRDDILALMDALKVEKAHFVAWSMGGGIMYRLIADHPDMVLSCTMISPVSPYGFGASKGVEGTPCYDDFAGSGGGVVNPVFIQRIAANDRSSDDPNSPRVVINTFYYKAPFRSTREEDFLTGSLMERTGPDKYPGDLVPSPNWPNVGPGVLGPVNCWSPKYLAHDVEDLLAASPKPPILWIRGSHDLIVSDNSMFDLAALGKLGYVPGWPGDEIFPPQPMVSQTRFVLEKYGNYREVVMQDTAHSPHIEKPEEFNKLFHEFLMK